MTQGYYHCRICGHTVEHPHACLGKPVGQKLPDYGVNLGLGRFESSPANAQPEIETPKQYVPKTPRIIPLLKRADEDFEMAKIYESEAKECMQRALKSMSEARAIIAE